MDITGKIDKIMPVQSGVSKATGNEWRKAEFVIETEDQYPKKVCFSAWSDKVDVVENLSEGQKVTVHFDVSSREYNEKWYTDLRAWKIDVLTAEDPMAAAASSSAQQAPPPPQPAPAPSAQNEQDDDLPF